jgi:hypothetical protein
VAVGATGEDYHRLALPVNNKLFFAGEATIREHPATAAGAYLSGLRVAGMVHKVCDIKQENFTVTKACQGNIAVDFDVQRLTEEWRKEISGILLLCYPIKFQRQKNWPTQEVSVSI